MAPHCPTSWHSVLTLYFRPNLQISFSSPAQVSPQLSLNDVPSPNCLNQPSCTPPGRAFRPPQLSAALWRHTIKGWFASSFCVLLISCQRNYRPPEGHGHHFSWNPRAHNPEASTP